MVLRSIYNSLSWTNKRRIDSLMVRFTKLKEWLKPKAEKIISDIEITKVTKPKKVEVVSELFPKNHKYIGYKIEKHPAGDRISMIKEPPHPKDCVCKECMDELANEIMNRREVKKNEAK